MIYLYIFLFIEVYGLITYSRLYKLLSSDNEKIPDVIKQMLEVIDIESMSRGIKVFTILATSFALGLIQTLTLPLTIYFKAKYIILKIILYLKK